MTTPGGGSEAMRKCSACGHALVPDHSPQGCGGISARIDCPVSMAAEPDAARCVVPRGARSRRRAPGLRGDMAMTTSSGTPMSRRSMLVTEMKVGGHRWLWDADDVLWRCSLCRREVITDDGHDGLLRPRCSWVTGVGLA